ncbi:MAG TPA: RNA methyltransferase [Thermomicrobiales bacterium]|nr:RNA methyltransferase [Thermomicrobiales bacterium]
MRPTAPTLSLRACRRLHSRKERRQTGLYIVEGIRPVRAALKSAHQIDLVLHAPDLLRSGYGQETVDLARARGIPCAAITAREFASISSRENPHGIACVGRQSWSALDDLTGDTAPVVALYAPQDPGNLGTILRTCDATGCAGVVLIGDAADPWHPAALRAAMGATFGLSLAACGVDSFIDWTSGQRLPVIGTSDRAGTDYATHRFARSFVLLMGSERQGLPSELEEIATTMVRIPMAGTVDSLNLAIATALVLYEARNQRLRPMTLED